MEISYLSAFLLGLLEGLTEFLPISSTGHLILAASLLGLSGDKIEAFEVIIQGAAILAVCWLYRLRLLSMVRYSGHDFVSMRLSVQLVLAFLPLAVLGFLFHKEIKAWLFNPLTVGIALILGGCIILFLERKNRQPTINYLDRLTSGTALKLGFLQALALIPGTSRSGAVIIGGLWLGLSRAVATEFSFLLAVPTLLVATAYQLYKVRDLLKFADLPIFMVGCLSAFFSAFFAVKFLVSYISSHNFKLFGWYRIVFGGFILLFYGMPKFRYLLP